MNIQRRSFLAGILSIGATPAIVKAGSLMKIWVPPSARSERKIIIANRGVSDVGFNLEADCPLYDHQVAVLDWKSQSGKGSWRPGSYEQAIGRLRRETGEGVWTKVRYSR
jgi:hypothetical protein